ncbi:MAG TPA: Mur ligase domain-containing protein [Caulobacteraceae bacterium]|jgi:UDP-N-acetylmuramate: L-alanyl-gamma-D-glutamyl-meso-diaminopimelate ligase|nr:Mur ligase domain-containing protein [Caulobacteraceae bacterium]
MRFYFLGIAGAGMSALASVLVSQGHQVSGSDDAVFPPVSDYLDRMAIEWREGFDAAGLPEHFDAAIIGSSAKLDLAHNVELAEIIRRGVPRYSFAEFLGRHTRGRDNVVIAGSFGKSTLTALAALLLIEAGRDPGYIVGAVPLDLAATGHGGTDAVFLMEGDEYIVGGEDRRSKFLLYHPGTVLITSVVHDHVNVFPTMADYEAPFAALIDLLPAGGRLLCAQGYEPLRRIAAGQDVIWYGGAPGPGYFADDVEIGEVTRFDLVTPGGTRIPLATELLGRHNIENIVGAAALLLERGEIDAPALQRGVAKFRGVARRLDKKTRHSRVPVYEGFGSSYEKARSAIEAIQLHFPDRRAVVVFEPHTFSWRNAAALSWYDSVFEGVARVLLLAPPAHGAEGHAQLSQDEIVARVRTAGVPVIGVRSGAAALAELGAELKGDEVVLLLSSGPLDGLAVSLPALLDERFG